MDILITGGSGFIGSQLNQHFTQRGYRVSNHPRGQAISLDKAYDVIINLAGHSLNKNRWNSQVKKLIYDSRLQTTQRIIDYVREVSVKPKLLISGSAIGYYEAENTFAHQLCSDWEAKAREAEQYGVRVCLMRTGIVLGKQGGALATLLFPFKLGLGAQLGSGSQWMSWIHMEDLINTVEYMLDHHALAGGINLTAPNPVTHKEFMQTLAAVLHRPCFLKFPPWLVKLLFGEMGEELLLNGKRILPEQLAKSGYTFRFERLDVALRNLLT